MQTQNTVVEVNDPLANVTGAGSDQSRLLYMLLTLRSDVETHLRMDGGVSFTTAKGFEEYVKANHAALITLTKEMWSDISSRETLFQTVENTGGFIWVDNQTEKVWFKPFQDQNAIDFLN